jgi:hypothetical protein
MQEKEKNTANKKSRLYKTDFAVFCFRWMLLLHFLWQFKKKIQMNNRKRDAN